MQSWSDGTENETMPVYSMFGILILATLASGPVQGAVFFSSLDQDNRTSACPDETVTYVCVVPDPTGGTRSTRWNGTIFQDQCSMASDPDQILLRHDNFVGSRFETRMCGSDLVAEIVNQIGTDSDAEFNSTLPVNATADLNGRTVVCSGPGASVGQFVEIGSATLTLTRPPPAPPLSAFTCTIAEAAVALVLSDWDTSFTDQYSVGNYCVSAMGASCNGTCVSPTEALDQCTFSQTSTFRVSAVNCGGQSDPESDPITVDPQVPHVPDVNMAVEYSESGVLLSIATTWMEETLTIVTPSSVCEVSPPTPPSGCTVPMDFQDGDVLYYVTYESDQGMVDTNCPVNCNSGECMDVFDQFRAGSSSYTVTVFASNVVGTATTNVFTISNTNNYFTVNISQADRGATVECSFQSSDATSCEIQYGTDPNILPFSASAQRSGDTASIMLSLNSSTTYFFDVRAEGSIVTVTERGANITTPEFTCDPNVLGTVDSSIDSECSGVLEGSVGSATIPNGTVCYNGTTVGSVANYICVDRFELPDGATNPRVCQPNGIWSRSDVTSCEITPPTTTPTPPPPTTTPTPPPPTTTPTPPPPSGGDDNTVIIIVIIIIIVVVVGVLVTNVTLIVLLHCDKLSCCLVKPSEVDTGKVSTDAVSDDNRKYKIRPVFLILLVALVITLPFVIYFYCCWRKKSGSPKTDDKVELKSVRTGSSPEATGGGDLNYAVPGDIKREEYPGTHDEYTLVNKSRKKLKPEDTQPTYAAPETIPRERVPETGDFYTMPDKPKKDSQRQALPVPPPQEAAPMYSEVGNSKKQPGPAQDVEYNKLIHLGVKPPVQVPPHSLLEARKEYCRVNMAAVFACMNLGPGLLPPESSYVYEDMKIGPGDFPPPKTDTALIHSKPAQDVEYNKLIHLGVKPPVQEAREGYDKINMAAVSSRRYENIGPGHLPPPRAADSSYVYEDMNIGPGDFHPPKTADSSHKYENTKISPGDLPPSNTETVQYSTLLTSETAKPQEPVHPAAPMYSEVHKSKKQPGVKYADISL